MSYNYEILEDCIFCRQRNERSATIHSSGLGGYEFCCKDCLPILIEEEIIFSPPPPIIRPKIITNKSTTVKQSYKFNPKHVRHHDEGEKVPIESLHDVVIDPIESYVEKTRYHRQKKSTKTILKDESPIITPEDKEIYLESYSYRPSYRRNRIVQSTITHQKDSILNDKTEYYIPESFDERRRHYYRTVRKLNVNDVPKSILINKKSITTAGYTESFKFGLKLPRGHLRETKEESEGLYFLRTSSVVVIPKDSYIPPKCDCDCDFYIRYGYCNGHDLFDIPYMNTAPIIGEEDEEEEREKREEREGEENWYDDDIHDTVWTTYPYPLTHTSCNTNIDNISIRQQHIINNRKTTRDRPIDAPFVSRAIYSSSPSF